MVQKVYLSQGLFALVDDEDFKAVSQFKWCVSGKSKHKYAVSAAGLLHRFVARPSADQDVDHVNGDGLDNRRSNLRACSHSQNMMNQAKQRGKTSRFKGVHLSASGWKAWIHQGGMKVFLGSYDSEIAAAKSYDRAAKVFFGQFAKTNLSMGLFDGIEDRLVKRHRRRRNANSQVDRRFRDEMSKLGITAKVA